VKCEEGPGDSKHGRMRLTLPAEKHNSTELSEQKETISSTSIKETTISKEFVSEGDMQLA
jgi:hypothetical protein